MDTPLINTPVRHWCEFEFISKTVKNPNIHIKGITLTTRHIGIKVLNAV